MPQAKDEEFFVSDGHILFVPAKRIWKVVALRKHAGGMFLAIDRSSYAARREVIKFNLCPLFGNSPSAEMGNTLCHIMGA